MCPDVLNTVYIAWPRGSTYVSVAPSGLGPLGYCVIGVGEGTRVPDSMQMAGSGACSGRRGRELPGLLHHCHSSPPLLSPWGSLQPSSLRWKALAFLGGLKIAEFLTHAWTKSSLGLRTTVTEWLSVGPASEGGFFKPRKGIAHPLLNRNSLRGPSQGLGQMLSLLCLALRLPFLSAVSLAGAFYGLTVSPRLLKMETCSQSGRIR